VRVSKTAIKNGVSFEKIGNLMINNFKKIPHVKGVKIYYVTEETALYNEIKSIGEKSRTVTQALDQVMNNLQFDCSTCNLKAICDEVDGMRELHFQSVENEVHNG
jgi:CO dehydrogenase/acetyl-CoA synthase beta subunit